MVRPRPPMSAATLAPTGNSPPGQDLMTPTHSMPLTSAISAHSPLRMCNSAWLRPNALTSITAWPSFGSGSGISRMTRTSGPPNSVLRIARMGCPLAAVNKQFSACLQKVPTGSCLTCLLLRAFRHLPVAREKAVNGHRTRAAQHQRDQARDIQEVDLVARRAELRAVGGEPDRVDGAEAVLQMNGVHRHEHHDDQRNTHELDERPDEDRQPAEELHEGRYPGRRLGER